ncbi:MAG: MerR family transcriptional regulator [Pseudomonadota bacterium]|nr:MerR family transcriptional regulator [Pseudomonadota bacterium]MDE3038403.1 MerR family transcriptional regulator [Pseudomonadota bacterium]
MPQPDSVEEHKADGAFKTISEASAMLGVPQHVLRFWESRFAQITPLKRSGGRRYYRPEDMDILSTIKHLLYKQGYTIEGAKKAFGARGKEETPPPAQGLTDRQHGQLSVIRQELRGLREALKPYITA